MSRREGERGAGPAWSECVKEKKTSVEVSYRESRAKDEMEREERKR